MAIPQSTIFKKASAANFKSILKQQKKDESDPKFAISDSLQEYQAQLEKSAGYQNQMKLDKANIRQDIINFVIDYTVSDLDALKGMDYQYRTRLEGVMNYDEDTAGGLMNTDTITIRPDVTLDVVLKYLRLRKEMPQNTDNIKTALATQVIGPKNSEKRLLQLALQIFNASIK